MKTFVLSELITSIKLDNNQLSVDAEFKDSIIDDHAVVDHIGIYSIMKLILTDDEYLYHSDDTLGETAEFFGMTKTHEINNGILELFDDLFVTREKTLQHAKSEAE